MSTLLLKANWNYPTSIKVGAGRARELIEACSSLGIKSPLLVTDNNLAKLPMIETALIRCQEAGLQCALFADIKANPTGENVLAGVDAYRNGRHDGVIAFGGGSALDAAKAIALMVGQNRSLWDFEDVGDNWQRVNVTHIAPVIALPSTAGTGSEVGRASVITDTQQQRKKIIFHPKMIPSIVILDPELTVALPLQITAATGMDALSHCLEAYSAPNYHPMAEGIALEGIRLIKKHLPRVIQNGNDLDARTQMLVASMMGATAFQRGLGAMHALAHPLGAIYDAHHGRLNAILMPYVLQANRSEIEQKIIRLASYLDIDNGFDGFLDWILQLREKLGIEHSLSEIGIDARDLGRIAIMATEDPSAQSNPILFTEQQYKNILTAAIHGDYKHHLGTVAIRLAEGTLGEL
ncbi:iron-containing alcohol dehydrogenase [Fluoribacter dumoffii]|uniref:NAD-dependent methanol dehydrogenase n=1 Tax=Fluoribacter dumoffii TaxID=463 RepID=A0A377G8E2_9GAMM|nr:iron-containing alcohol dehydrogenase [Fluoribacter dumoffii]KTC89958.1 alcohol dehydrogenase [Fluoribacter dumoffii NY 23]MCW8385256.1 iron-containing alcohol dehydrogenase [Fluoribacter dumoffii]MCW8496447.1 iron-containing alcohol dehydrogenase [Fluoribacter dumoffii]STO21076.1 NAD-dependent methanol dehydrogenase [Fluoribacter dumoffii]